LLLLLLPATAALFVCREGTSSCVGCTDKTSEQLSRRTDRIWSVAVPSENLLLFVCFSVAVCRRRRGRATAAARKAAGRRCREEKKNHVVSADTYPTVYCTVAARFRAKSRANESSRKIRTRRENLLLLANKHNGLHRRLAALAGRPRPSAEILHRLYTASSSFVRSFVRSHSNCAFKKSRREEKNHSHNNHSRRSHSSRRRRTTMPGPTLLNGSGSSSSLRRSVFGDKTAYKSVASDFDRYHRHDLNVALHLLTTGIGLWGAIRFLVVSCASGKEEELSSSSSWFWWVGGAPTALVYAYAAFVALTVPSAVTATLHTAFVYACVRFPVEEFAVAAALPASAAAADRRLVCLAVVAVGYGLQDVAHYLCGEKTYMGSYIAKQPWIFFAHTIWLSPLVIDAVSARYWFLPHLFLPRNRCVVTGVANRGAVDEIRAWIRRNVPSTPETTHVWPHDNAGTDRPTAALERDAAIAEEFRRVFASKHYDVEPIVPMNEIYVTAVGAKREINSDAVFYTPHCDGPYWFLPFCSVYRVLVGITPNSMVRTRFNLQHESRDQVLDLYGVVGFDYNRELHWIDHVPGAKNAERRSLMKLHYVVYPKGWARYGKLCMDLNTSYNTWARGNFLKTLRPKGMYEYVLAWWIWLTTWTNAVFEEYFGWSNLVYIAGTAALFYAAKWPLGFVVCTSFRHYFLYISTFAFRNQGPVAHGYFIRDAKLYKTISLMHLGRRILPAVRMPGDWPVIVAAAAGFSITILATARLGIARRFYIARSFS